MTHSYLGRLPWKFEKHHTQILKSRKFPGYSEKKQQHLVTNFSSLYTG